MQNPEGTRGGTAVSAQLFSRCRQIPCQGQAGLAGAARPCGKAGGHLQRGKLPGTGLGLLGSAFQLGRDPAGGPAPPGTHSAATWDPPSGSLGHGDARCCPLSAVPARGCAALAPLPQPWPGPKPLFSNELICFAHYYFLTWSLGQKIISLST